MDSAAQQRYGSHYSERKLWNKLRRTIRVAGRELIEKALLLYFVLRDPRAPVWAKTTVIAALGYFIAPIDAIPDLLPGAGFIDDLGVLALALGSVAASITPRMRERAGRLVAKWFGDPATIDDAFDGPVIEVEATVVAREPS